MTICTPMTLASIDAGAGLGVALAMGRSQVLGAIRDARLRGRGGAGFPTGVKWNLAAAAQAPRKYVVCNADEGEPGTFKDRVILTEWPALVIEGMTIAAYAVGASEGIVYLRGEYAYLREGIEACLARLREDGALGTAIRGHEGFAFDVRVRLGSGAYVCGEETALIESLEGHRGESRNRPPFPVHTGFDGMPTIVNNVETLAWVAAIFARGVEWFLSLGTDLSRGPKLLSVSGDVARPGVYEFPLGTRLRDVLVAAGGEHARAVVVGGASGRVVPASAFDRAISYEDVATGGAVIVLGPDRDLLGVAECFLAFFAEESCGQCTPCRVGNVRLLEGVRALRRGTCSSERLDALRSLGMTLQDSSKCGLGQSSPNAFLSIVEHFRDEVLGRSPTAPRGE